MVDALLEPALLLEGVSPPVI